ncbi:hypothetical protein [Paenibacillus sp. FSL R5-0345]|uniref:hypothetical protein n=1 Tax=Paenibacillus sp. FSL R5-0345 TaxID=1536770 RepID=UPI000A93EB08|nr:hypothetical protein [Paenibacillus sp. FSL R5-0345]
MVIETKKIKAPIAELKVLHEIYLKEALYKTKTSSTAFKAANKEMDEVEKYEGQFVDGIDKYRKKYGI